MGPVHEPYVKPKNGFGMIDLQKHIWEGWTVGDFVERLAPELVLCRDAAGADPLPRSRNSPRGAGRISPITKSTFRALLPILPGGIVYIDSSRR